jgi:hypothetical protein
MAASVSVNLKPFKRHIINIRNVSLKHLVDSECLGLKEYFPTFVKVNAIGAYIRRIYFSICGKPLAYPYELLKEGKCIAIGEYNYLEEKIHALYSLEQMKQFCKYKEMGFIAEIYWYIIEIPKDLKRELMRNVNL